jgi:hypothetical protein
MDQHPSALHFPSPAAKAGPNFGLIQAVPVESRLSRKTIYFIKQAIFMHRLLCFVALSDPHAQGPRR